jgi:hypothetical protein
MIQRHTPQRHTPMSRFRRAQWGGKSAVASQTISPRDAKADPLMSTYVRAAGDGPTDKTSQYLHMFQINAYA